MENHGHWRTFVQDSKLTLWTLLVGWVGEDATVKQSTIGVCNHGADVSRAVRLATLSRIFQAVDPLLDRFFPVQAVTLVHRINSTLLGTFHVGMGEDELAESVVKREAVDGAAFHCDDQHGRRAVHGEAAGDEFTSGLQQIFLGAFRFGCQLVNTEDCAHRHTGVEVG